MLNPFPQERTHQDEWRNYWQSRSGFRGRLQSVGHLSLAVKQKFGRGLGSAAVIPVYLSRAQIRTAIRDKGNLSAFPAKIDYPAVTAMSAQMLTWAKDYEKRFQDFLTGKKATDPDPEINWNLHQFGWLLMLVLSDAIRPAEVRNYLKGWINRLGNAKSDSAWRSFSICERVANWIHLHNLIDLSELGDELIKSVSLQAEHLATHLESFRGEFTNNHLINNGRCLYLVGSWLGRSEMTAMGRAILIEEAKRQYTPEGFLDEGSSHYQLVFTRVYLEALATANRLGDTTLLQGVGQLVLAMLKSCRFFLDPLADERWQIPLIGDVSPDPPPGLFARQSMFWQWAGLAHQGQLTVAQIAEPWFARARDDAGIGPIPGWSCFTGSGHYRWSGDLVTLWCHARRRGLHRRHGHNDWGSFQLNVAGEPIFVDPGRYTYCDGELQTFDGRKTLNQNTVAVDGFEQSPILKRPLFDAGYLGTDGAEIRFSADATQAQFDLRIRGYERLLPPMTHVRSFLIRPANILISDQLESRVSRRTVTAFHLHPRVTCARASDNTYLLRTPKGRAIKFSATSSGIIQVKQAGDANLPGGYCYPVYGQREQTTTLFVLHSGPRVLAQYEIGIES